MRSYFRGKRFKRNDRTQRPRLFESLEQRCLLSGSPPLLHETDFNYLGAFRLPDGTFGGSRFGFGGTALAFNANNAADPSDDTLFIVGHDHHQQVAEISIPSPVSSGNLSDLSTAGVTQPFSDVSDGLKGSYLEGNVKIGGLLVDDGQLLWSAFEFYDADTDAQYSHGTSSLNLSVGGDAQGMYRVGTVNPGFTAGYMAHVPAQWQDAIGAPILTGQSSGAAAIVTRTSAGPALFGFDPSDFGAGTVPSTPLLYYRHPGDGTQELSDGMFSQNPYYNFNSRIGGVVFPEGSRSVVFFGRHGLGNVCYGTPEACNDPDKGGKGFHDVGGNYVYYAWAYDVLDLLSVKSGEKQPWEIEPYDVWEVDFPIPKGNASILGVAYDPLTSRLFVSQDATDFSNPFNPKPLIHVYDVETVPDTTAPVISDIEVGSVIDVRVTVSWTSDELADSLVEYWPSSDPSDVSSVASSSLDTTHSLTVSGTQPETSYGYRVHSTDSVGNSAVSADFAFTTAAPDTTAPSLFSVNVAEVLSGGATVSWATDEAATSVVEYWLASDPAAVLSQSSSSFETGHSQSLTGLQADRSYGYRVKSSDLSGNEAVSADSSFTTLAVPSLLNDAAGYWKLDEQGGVSASDASGGGQNGTVEGGASFVPGTFGNGLRLDGANDYVDVGNLNVTGNQMTLAAWVQTDLADPGDDRIVAKATTSAEQGHYFMLSTLRSGQENRLRFRLKTGSNPNSGTTTLIAHSGHIAQGEWHHVAATYDGSMMRLFLNGAEVGSVAKTGSVATSTSVPVYLGANPGGVTAGQPAKFWDGQLDEVGIWNRALTAQELQVLIDEGVDESQQDTEAPIISDVGVASIGSGQAAIEWTTNEVADSRLEYWLDSSPQSVNSVSSSAMVTSHSVQVTGLLPESSYGYRVKSTDAAGNVAQSADLTFVTSAIGQEIYSYDNPAPLPASDPAHTTTVQSVGELVAAVNGLQSGKTISIAAGTYDLSGVADALYVPQGISNWAIRGATGDRDDVVIRGDGMQGSVRFGFWIGNSSDGTIADLTVRSIREHGIIANPGAHDMLYHGLRIIDIGDQFIKSNPTGYSQGNDRGTVAYSIFEYTTDESGGGAVANYTNAVDVHGGDAWRIHHNLFRNIVHRPGEGVAGPAILMWNGSTNTLAEGNSFINVSRGIAFGLIDNSAGFDHQGGTIRNNMFHQDGGLTNALDVAIGVADSPDTKVYHNTVVTNGTYPSAIEYRFSSTTVDVRNNLTDAAITARDGASGVLAGNVTTANSQMFVNAAAGDLHLVSTANVIDQGVPIPGETLDIDGQLRDSQPDVGADEFASGNETTSVTDLGPVDFLVYRDQSVSGTENWYQLTATQAGVLTVEALFLQTNGDVDVQVYNAADELLGASSSSTDNERVDVTVSELGIYLVRLLGANDDVDLRLTNLVSEDFDTMYLTGTPADETIVVDASAMSLSVHGVSYAASETVGRFQVDGGEGHDRITVLGSGENDAVTVRVGSLDITNSRYDLHAASVETVDVHAGGGNDTAVMYDSPGDDHLVAHGNAGFSRLSGTGFSNVVRGFDEVQAVANAGGHDAITFYDSAGDDRFISHAAHGYSSLSGDGYYIIGRGFQQTEAFADAGGAFDRAEFYDSAEDDRFIFHAADGYSLMSGDGLYNIARRFEHSEAFAGAGGDLDRAEFYDSAADDHFIGHAADRYGVMSGGGYYGLARGFGRIDAFAGAGGLGDRAEFFDSTGDDRFIAHAAAGYSLIEGAGFYYIARGFAQTEAHAGAGGTLDRAEFYDSSGADRYIAHAAHGYSLMTGGSFFHIARGFGQSEAFAGTSGSLDRAEFYDSEGNDRFIAHAAHGYSSMSGDGFSNIARGFYRNEAYAGAGGTLDLADFFDSAGDDRFIADVGNGLSYMEGAGYYNFARGFSEFRAFAGAGGDNDRVDFFDSASNDLFEARTITGDSWMRGSGRYYYAKGFDAIHAHAIRGGSDRATLHELETGGRLIGSGASAVYTANGGRATDLWDFDFVDAVPEPGNSPTYEIGDVDFVFEELGA